MYIVAYDDEVDIVRSIRVKQKIYQYDRGIFETFPTILTPFI